MTASTQILQAALRDLEVRQKSLREEMTTVEQAINGIRAVLAKDASLLNQIPLNAVPQPAGAGRRYDGLSVRWAVLQYLAEDAVEPATTAEIADALLKGGMTTSGRDFVSNVSAVISVMVNKRLELTSVEGKYSLSDAGRASWNAIKMTNQYRARSLEFPANLQ